MNKTLLAMACAILLMTACSENDVIENNGNDAIVFDTYVGKQTRASELTIGNLTDFGVYAYVAASTPFELMANEKISKAGNGSVWTYSNIKYWPENDNVNFFAYAPYKANWGDFSSDDKSFEYTVPALASAQEDLIGATSFDKSKGSNSGKVNLAFKHLLSKIGFSAKSDIDYGDTKVTITNLEVLYKADAIDNKSTFTFAGSGDSGGTVEAGTWAATAATQFPAGTSGELITNDVIMSTTAQSLHTYDAPATAANTFLMLLPQNVQASDIQAKITYTVTYTNPTAVVTNVKTIDLPAANWVMGKAYTYNFTIGLSQIIFDGITVDNWIDDATQPAPVPVQ